MDRLVDTAGNRWSYRVHCVLCSTPGLTTAVPEFGEVQDEQSRCYFDASRVGTPCLKGRG